VRCFKMHPQVSDGETDREVENPFHYSAHSSDSRGTVT
jgi:hypothetical protein